ncbi:MAG: helix-turn-helix domain-containing protein [Bacilli bacterium]|nr:helix-turn-helix domain-containing protein [Bacilli bacterium]
MAIKFKRINDLRVDNDLLQREVAEIIGANKNTYPHWESGLYEIPLEAMDKLATYYKVSVDYITGLSDDKGNTMRSYDKQILPKRLKKIRIQNKLSQEKMGYTLGNMSQIKLSRYENGVTTIPFSTLYLFAKTFNISIDYLMGRNDAQEIKTTIKK